MTTLANKSALAFIINDKVKAVKLSYCPERDESDWHGARSGDKPQHLIAKTILDLAVGDYVLVETDSRHNQTVAKVTAINVEPDLMETKKFMWVTDVVDRTALNKLWAMETEAQDAIAVAARRKLARDMRASMFESAEEEMASLQLTDLSDAAEPPALSGSDPVV